MIMIVGEGEISEAEGKGVAYADTSEKSLFYEAELGGVPAFAALEYMSQTMALVVGYFNAKKGIPPRIGYVLGSRRLEVDIPVFRKGERYRVEATCLYSDEAFGSFDCRISDGEGRSVARGVLSAYQPENAADGMANARMNGVKE